MCAVKTGIKPNKTYMALTIFALLGACGGFDPDLRGRLGAEFDTANAAQNKSQAMRPAADARGIIEYPTYQVAVAQRGDNLDSIAARVGISADELARHNGLTANSYIREGDMIVLPRKTQATYQGSTQIAQNESNDDDVGAIATRALAQLSQIDRTELAPAATPVAEAAPQPVSQPAPIPNRPKTRPQNGPEPILHTVKSGETAYTIARSYDVSPKALGEWNNLDARLSVREGQRLMIPTGQQSASAAVETAPSQPGKKSIVPPPPSAADPLPDEPSAVEINTPAQNTASAQETVDQTAQQPVQQPVAEPAPVFSLMQMPIQGSIIRDFEPGKTEGIDISAAAGSTIVAAADGKIAAITQNTDKLPIVVIKHPNNLLTVYANIVDIKVSQGQSVSRGDVLGVLGSDSGAVFHFEVREGLKAVDPTPFLLR